MFNMQIMATAAHNVLVKKANALATIEGALARRGASAVSRAVPTAAEQALGHATASAASRGVPRSVSSIVGSAESGVRAIPKGPPPVPAQAKGLFAAPAVSPFAGTAPGPTPKIAPMAPTPEGSMQHASFLARQPGFGQGHLAGMDALHNMAASPSFEAVVKAKKPELHAQYAGDIAAHRAHLVNTQGLKLAQLMAHLKFASSLARQGSMNAGAAQSAKGRSRSPSVSFGKLIESIAGSGAV